MLPLPTPMMIGRSGAVCDSASSRVLDEVTNCCNLSQPAVQSIPVNSCFKAAIDLYGGTPAGFLQD